MVWAWTRPFFWTTSLPQVWILRTEWATLMTTSSQESCREHLGQDVDMVCHDTANGCRQW